MLKRVKSTPCPHCGQVFQNNNLKRHVAVCLADPEVLGRVTKVLKSDAEPTRIVPQQEYTAISSGTTLPGANVLKKQCGGSWTAVAETFGLHCDGYTRGPNSSYKYSPPQSVDDSQEQVAIQARRAQYDRAWPLSGEPDWRVIRHWDMRRRCWIPVAAQQVYVLR